jgi:hypothetical protein
MPESRAGTKARIETSSYDDYSYEEADTKDGSSTRPSTVPKEAHTKWQVQAPGAGQHAEKMWAQMQNSPRLGETIDATRHGRPQYSGTLWSRKSSTDEESEDADESAAIDRTERALLAELQRVAERRRSLRASLSMVQLPEEAIADDEPETTVEEIMQRGKTRERLAAERAQAEATHVEGERQEALAQQRAAEAEARERHTAQELERMRLTLASMHHKESTSRDAVLVALMETMKQLKPEPREPKVYTPKDIRDGIVPPCPMDKNATEMREWATTLAGAGFAGSPAGAAGCLSIADDFDSSSPNGDSTPRELISPASTAAFTSTTFTGNSSSSNNSSSITGIGTGGGFLHSQSLPQHSVSQLHSGSSSKTNR